MTKNLKFLLFPILFTLISVHTSKAQYYNYDRNMSLGLTFSPNMGWLTYGEGDTRESSAKAGYSYGLVADLGFAKNYFFSTGLLINTLYSETSGQTSNSSLDKVYRLQYAEVPLAIKLKTNAGGAGRFYGQFGFTAGVKVSGKERPSSSTSYTAIDGDDIFRLGLQIGAGAEWRLGSSLSALTGLSYNNGFTRTMTDGSPKMSYLALNIGLLF